MAGDKRRDAAQVARDRKRIADLYLKGWLQVDIADEIGVDTSTVSRDLKAIRGEWLQSTLMDFNEARAQELAKIDNLELTYWQAWQRSTENKEVESTKVIESGKGEDRKPERLEAATRSEGQAGDPRFLQGVQWCIERRCKLLGLDETNGTEGKPFVIKVLKGGASMDSI
jgi:hypothetical protein